MLYEFRCERCFKVSHINMDMNIDHPKTMDCKYCGNTAWRLFNSYIAIPDHFKATGETNKDGPTSLEHLTNQFKHSHPSGRDSKIFY